MSFTPTTAQLELLADLEMARMPVALIANRLGVDHATFKVWTARLDAVRNFEEPPPSNAEITRKPLVERERGLRVIAERIFDGELQQPPRLA
jgi:hypothetical protein